MGKQLQAGGNSASLLPKEATRDKATLWVLPQACQGKLGRACLGKVGNRANPGFQGRRQGFRAYLVIILASV